MADARLKIDVILEMLHLHAGWGDDHNHKVILQYQPDPGYGDEYFTDIIEWLEAHFGRTEHEPFTIESRAALGDYVIRPEYILSWPKLTYKRSPNNLIGVVFQQESAAALFKIFFQNDDA